MRLKGIRKTAFAVFLCFGLAGALAGCGKTRGQTEKPAENVPVSSDPALSDITENTILLAADGSVTEYAVEDFGPAGISPEGAEDYIRQEAEAVNQKAGTTRISLDEYQEEGDLVKTKIRYSDMETYNQFNHLDYRLSVFEATEADAAAADEVRQKTAAESRQKVETENISQEELAEAGYQLSDLETGKIGGASPDDASAGDAVQATFTDAAGTVYTSSDVQDSGNTTCMMLMTPEKVRIILKDGVVDYVGRHASFSGTEKNEAATDGEGEAALVFHFTY